MDYKYIILDFGKVIAASTTGYWDITPCFLEHIEFDKNRLEEFMKIRKKYKNILNEKVSTLEEEYDMFIRFYESIFKELNYSLDLAKKIAYDRTYNYRKYTLYDNIYEELNQLKEKYRIILLTDNWPCVINYLKEYNLYDYFEKIYISSFYGVLKEDKELFDYPINDFNIKSGEALFIDDCDKNLDAAVEKELDVFLMDRDRKNDNSKYTVINDLFNL